MKEFVEKLIGRLEECKKKEKCNLYSGIEEGFGYSHCSDAFEDGQTLGAFNAYSSMLDFIKELAEEYNNGWIPCEKELPETNESVLCWAKSTARGGDVCFVGSYHKGFWFLQSSANTHSFPGQYKIVAWQQLPAPYQKGSDV
ncbi:MAG: DUF551 domain-containing protein [Bacteroidales bacterium]|nr:DUF551 domain-containing protein [Bacteroidales bacterium]